MGTAKAAFTCLCPQKVLILRDREEVQREQVKHLSEKAKELGFEGDSVILPGGCIVARHASIGEYSGYAAALLGQIDNRFALEEKYLTENVSHNFAKSANALTDAELVCYLYNVCGRLLPQKLRGDFTFVLFDPAQGRVLAAASPTSSTHLWQARGADNSLIITTRGGPDLPSGAHSVVQIPAGYLKYGWSSEPQRYCREQAQLESRISAAAAAKHALRGIEVEHDSPQSLPPRTSIDAESGDPPSPQPKKTRRGKRAGRNQKLRAELSSLTRVSGEFSQPSFESAIGSLQSAGSFGSRADEQSWWRTNTPRQSLDYRATPRAAETPSSPYRRSSMSITAAPFTPGQPGLFSRHSVPSAKSQASALHLEPQTVPPAGEHVVLAGTSIPIDSQPATSPFEDEPMKGAPNKPEQVPAKVEKSGKADAAWNEGIASSSAFVGFWSKKTSTQKCPVSSSKSSSTTSLDQANKEAETVSSGIKGPGPPRSICVASSTAGDSDSGMKGMSPGGSPRRPPRAPVKGPLKHIFKAIMTRKPSHVTLKAAAGGGALQSSRARSSSHGNLVDLDGPTGLWDAPQSGASSGSESFGPVAQHKRTTTTTSSAASAISREGSMDAHAASSLQQMKLTNEPHRNMSPALWLAQRTRNIFGKSKSCTDLGGMERPAQLCSPSASDVEVA